MSYIRFAERLVTYWWVPATPTRGAAQSSEAFPPHEDPELGPTREHINVKVWAAYAYNDTRSLGAVPCFMSEKEDN